MTAPRFPKLRCSKCGVTEATTMCRFCSHDKLLDVAARVAQKIAGDPPRIDTPKFANG